MQITIKTNREFYHPQKKWVKTDTQFVIEVDEEGTPLSSFWANCLKDAEIDNAISIVSEEVITTNSKTKK